jgi:hypothetical protein
LGFEIRTMHRLGRAEGETQQRQRLVDCWVSLRSTQPTSSWLPAIEDINRRVSQQGATQPEARDE